jgi:4-oxalocrotonate tautomerase
MPLIQVTMIEGRTPEQKRALLTAITNTVHETIDAPLDSIRVWIVDVPSQQFMSAGELVADRRAVASMPPAAVSPLGEPAGDAPGSPLPPSVDPIGGSSDPLTSPGGAALP